MDENLDKFILKVLFGLMICALLVLYRYAHRLFYPSLKDQVFKSFSPTHNPADSLHFFSRLLGIGIIYSSLHIDLDFGILYATLDLFIQGLLGLLLYLGSLYIMESITLYNFEYNDEIQKRKNLCYSIISFSQALAISFIIKAILTISDHSLPILFFLWLFSLAIMGFSVKTYKLISPLSFNKLIIQKDLTLAFSFSGFVLGIAILEVSIFSQNVLSLQSYGAQVILNILKACMVFPLIHTILNKIFNIQPLPKNKRKKDDQTPNWGYGVYEGALFLTTCLLTAIIINQIYFGGFYPSMNPN